MTKTIFNAVIIFLFSAPLSAQIIDSLNYGPEPIGGITKLALTYYKIDFSDEQRKKLENVELEFIYSVDSQGNATLEEVNGIIDLSILDSLKTRSTVLPKFYPRIINGVAQNSIFFMKLQFPKYSVESELTQTRYYHYKKPSLGDFEYINKSGKRMDFLIGGVVNGFGGNAKEYLEIGGGMKMDLMYYGKRRIGAGICMNFYGNKLKKQYPINSMLDQNDAPPTLLLGLGLGKSMRKKGRNEFNLQLELNYAIQNVTAPVNNINKDFIQLNGFSPGIVASYLIQIGNDKLTTYYGAPALFNHHINLHGAIRPIFFDLKQASGIMLELGLSYRMEFHFVNEYKFKPEFFNKN